ncbi:MAG: glucose-6-phosphate isomerase [Planctomycetota bacterium]
MPQSEIKLYYKNVMADVIGAEHGISEQQWNELKKTFEEKELIPQIMQEIAGGKRHPGITRTVYGTLPTNGEIADAVMKLVERFKDRCENLVVFGIGGSALGNISLQTALNPFAYNFDDRQRRGGPCLFVFDNVDPDQLGSFLKSVDNQLDRTIFNFISKSGRTAETAAQFLLLRNKLTDKYGPEHLAEHLVVTTGFETGKDGKHSSTFYKIAKASKPELPLLQVPDGVGGRFSVLSAVGLFSAAMCGIDIEALLAGARAMHERVSRENFEENPAAINAAISYHYYMRGKRNSVIMPYSYALKDMADWYRQIWAESLGKSRDLEQNEVFIGPTPIKALGATDQHSQVQLYREGPNDKLFTFLQVENFDYDAEMVMGPQPDCAPELSYLAGKKMSVLLNNEKNATEYALLEDKRPCLTVLFDRVNAYSVGQFIYLYEVTTSFAGALFGIDTYNQPAVELGKEATFALMGKSGRCDFVGTSYEDFAEKIRSRTKIDDDYLV